MYKALPSDLQSFCREISLQPYGRFFVHDYLFFSRCLQNFLTFAVLIMLCLGVSLLGFFLLGTLCDSCIRISVSFFRVVKFLAIISLNRFFILFFILEPLQCECWHFLCYTIDLVCCFVFVFICLSVCCSDWVISIILSSRLLMLSSVSFSL